MSTRTPNKNKPGVVGRVLGIDPGFDRVGAAILEGSNTKQVLLFSECIQTSTKDPHEKRLEKVGMRIREIIEEWHPSVIAIEKLFFNQNTTSALKVAEARGVIIFEGVTANVKIQEYSPQEIKLAVTGYGKAAKTEVETMTLRLLGITQLKTKPRFDDEVDAIAVGITHLASAKHRERLST